MALCKAISYPSCMTFPATSLGGKIALVTGAGRGLGRAMASALGAAGAHVVVHGRDQAAAEETVATIIAAAGSAETALFELADDVAIDAAVDALASRHGRIDVLVNNAGARDRRPLGALDPDAVRRVIDVNLVAPLQLSRRVAAVMPVGGRIINVTSIAGPIARAGDVAYTASKGGLEALTRALAAELGSRQISVNAIAPGFFATEANAAMVADQDIARWLERRTSLGRWGRPEEVAGAVVFFASLAASYITGQVLAIDGGYLAHF